MQYDFLVVGGGIIGLLTARELRRTGAKVALVEKTETGRESSWAGGGILSPLYPWRYPESVTLLARWSQQVYPELCTELHQETEQACEWTPSGLLVLEVGEQAAAQQWAAHYGYHLETLDADQVQAQVPALGQPVPALWFPQLGQVRNPRLAKALTLSLQKRGVTVYTHTEITGFAREGDRVLGVQTRRGVLQAKAVVLTAGAWSMPLLQGLGLEMALAPIRGQMALLRAAPDLLAPIVLQHSRYLIPRRDGHILVGSTLEVTGFQKETTEEALQSLLHTARTLVPALADCPLELHWAGLRPGSPQGVPLIGPAPGYTGLFLNTGHFRNGVVLAPASARLAADLLLGRPPLLPPEPYLPKAQHPATLNDWLQKLA